jgi:peroxiredoxin
MESWKADQDAANVTFVPDGNGEFTEKLGKCIFSFFEAF